MLALLLFAQAAATQPTAKPVRPPLANFVFRDWRVRDAYRADDPRFLKCVPTPPIQRCLLTDDRMGGVKTLRIGVAFGSNGLFALEARFPHKDSGVVEAALRDRYGEPCDERVEGIRVWCFTDGKGVFDSHHEPGEGVFQFATPDAAKQQVVRDF